MNTQRRGRRMESARQPINQLPWGQPQLTLEPSRILSGDHLESIHLESQRLLHNLAANANPVALHACPGPTQNFPRFRIGHIHADFFQHAQRLEMDGFEMIA